MEARSKVHLIGFIVLVGFLSSVVVHYWRGSYERLAAPHSSYLANSEDWTPGSKKEVAPTKFHLFGDFHDPLMLAKERDPYSGATGLTKSSYFPFAHFVLLPFTWMKYSVAISVYFSIFGLSLIYLGFRFLPVQARTERALYTVLIFFCAYPVHFLLDRGNTEGFLFVFLLVFVVSILKGRFYWAGIALACATSMKGYPLILGLILIERRQWKPVFVFALSCLSLTTVSLLYLKGSPIENWLMLREIQNQFGLALQSGVEFWSNAGNVKPELPGGFGYQASLYIGLATISFFLKQIFDTTLGLHFVVHHYNLVMMPLLLGVVACYFRKDLDLWKKLALAVFSFQVFTPFSFDYRLVHLILPLSLFLSERRASKKDQFYSVLFGLLLIPKTMIMLSSSGVSVGTVVNPILILVFSLSVLHDGLRGWFSKPVVHRSERSKAFPLLFPATTGVRRELTRAGDWL